MQSQLEFLTLTGVIFNALMQGYVCVNSVYTFLIENIYRSPQDFSQSAFAQSIITDQHQNQKYSENVNDYESFSTSCWPSDFGSFKFPGPKRDNDDCPYEKRRKRDRLKSCVPCFRPSKEQKTKIEAEDAKLLGSIQEAH